MLDCLHVYVSPVPAWVTVDDRHVKADRWDEGVFLFYSVSAYGVRVGRPL